MYSGVTLDLQANEVRVDEAAFSEQWAELYAALFDAAASNDPWLTADDLKDLGHWTYKKPDSIGKEILRHIRDLARHGDRRVIEAPPRGGTRRWRLAVPLEAVKVIPNTGHVRDWLDRRRTTAAPRGLDVGLVRDLVRASVSFQGGHMEEALEILRANVPLGAASVWDAWRALLLARVQVRLFNELDDRWEDTRAVRDAWRAAHNALGKAMDARLTATLAYAHRFGDAESALAALRRLAASLEHSGDLSSLANVTNMLGLLTMRRNSPTGQASLSSLRSARAHFERAAGLFGLSGDPWALQAALFNTACALCQEREAEGMDPDKTVFEILDLSLEVCDHFHVGDDSLQAEAVGAEWAWQIGRTDLARRYCERALARAHIDNTFEQAILARLLGRQAMAEGRASEARRQLETSRRLFGEVGDRAAVEDVRKRLLSLSPGSDRRARNRRTDIAR